MTILSDINELKKISKIRRKTVLLLNVKSPDGGRKAQYEYETKFANKIYLANRKPFFKKLYDYAQQCIYAHTGFGYSAIAAISFMDEINSLTDEQFLSWYDNTFVKNERSK